MSGNKGAVSIRLDYYDTSFCFITAHLAAGHVNMDERNADYWTIVNGLHFLRGKTIESHEYVPFPRLGLSPPELSVTATLSG